jgi:pectin methylesterase-like acyl-CoA thioesterase
MDYFIQRQGIFKWVPFILVLLLSTAGATIWTVGPSVGPGIDFTTIQAAINYASDGDAIEVRSGTYLENVDVNKQLTLQGMDTGAGLPVVDGSGSVSSITLSADGCTLQG